jgi:hypothetical protein
MDKRRTVPRRGTRRHKHEGSARRGGWDYSDEDGNVHHEQPVEILIHQESVRTRIVAALLPVTILLVFVVVGLTLAGSITPWVALAVTGVSAPLTVAMKTAVAFYF